MQWHAFIANHPKCGKSMIYRRNHARCLWQYWDAAMGWTPSLMSYHSMSEHRMRRLGDKVVTYAATWAEPEAGDLIHEAAELEGD
jgi:hypothetical protein